MKSKIIEVNDKLILTENDSDELILDLKKCNEKVDFFIKQNLKFGLSLINIPSNLTLNFNLEENSNLKLKIINDSSNKSLNFNENLANSCYFSCFLVDLSKSDTEIKNLCNMNGEGSSFDFEISSLSNKDIVKKYEISCNHNSLNQNSNVSLHGVALQNGQIIGKGITWIKENSIKSNAKQNERIILFDKESVGKGYPTLKIDCNDVKASHGCAIGSLNDNHLFYLLSRGLSYNEARKLITLGYLQSIKVNFNIDEQETIDSLITGGF